VTLGQINTSLLSFSRTIEDYNKLAKQELVPDKQTKAYDRIKNFRTELSDYRERFERLKHETEEKVSTKFFQCFAITHMGELVHGSGNVSYTGIKHQESRADMSPPSSKQHKPALNSLVAVLTTLPLPRTHTQTTHRYPQLEVLATAMEASSSPSAAPLKMQHVNRTPCANKVSSSKHMLKSTSS
jgi:hypothetical protein